LRPCFLAPAAAVTVQEQIRVLRKDGFKGRDFYRQGFDFCVLFSQLRQHFVGQKALAFTLFCRPSRSKISTVF
jgi:hypothetical protein